MKRLAVLFVVIITLSATLVLAQQDKHSYKPEGGYVSDAATAIKVAEAVLVPIYGEETISKEKPLKAELKDGAWIVEGTLHCPEGEICKGGVATIEISKDDCRILRVSHGK